MMKAGHSTPRSNLINARGCSYGTVRRLGRVCSNELNAPQERGYNFCDTPSTRNARAGFTLAEMLVSIAVMIILVLLVTQLINTAATTVRPANKHIDTDTQARVVLDRMALDFAQMLKRTDVDYYVKAPAGYKKTNPHGKGVGQLQKGQQGNDQIAFFTQASGIYPQTTNQSSISLVAYRINNNSSSPSYLMLERMGRGLLWNPGSGQNSPMIFLPLTIDGTWPAATNNDGSAQSQDSTYETIGPQVFRLEYYYLLKDGTITDVPAENWISTQSLDANLNAFGDVEAIGIAIAAIDPASRSMISQQQLINLMSDLPDFETAHGNGYGNPAKTISSLEGIWESSLESDITAGQAAGSPFPPSAAAAVRIYSRYFDLKTLPGF